MKRPHLCPDESCTVLSTNYSRDGFDKGGSYDCYGSLAEPHEVTWRETIHTNDLSHCTYTPFKGHIRFLVNEGDIWLMFLACGKVLDHLTPLICDNCGEVPRLFGGTTKKAEQTLCRECWAKLERPSTITPEDVEELLKQSYKNLEELRPVLRKVFGTVPENIRVK